MKLISCYVYSFGKLNDFKYDFSDGLNVIKEKNGWGKSTFAYFIKAMFYGLKGGGKRSVSDNERARFRPWNSTEKFGGYVVFERGNKTFRLERFFGTKEAEDELTLSDAETGKVFSNTGDLGKRIFGIDEDGFFSTTYFCQDETEIKSVNGLTEKFVGETDESDEKFDSALLKIKNKAKYYKYSGNRGKIPELKAKLFAAEENARAAREAAKTATVLKKECDFLEQETASLEKRIADLGESVKAEGEYKAAALKKQRLEKLKAEEAEYRASLDDEERVLRGNNPSERELRDLENCYDELQQSLKYKQILVNEISLGQANSPADKKSRSQKFLIAAVSLSALFAVVGVAGLILAITVLAVCGFVACAVCVAASAFFAATYKTGISEEKAAEARIGSKKAKLAEYAEICDSYESSIKKYLTRYGVNVFDFRAAVSSIRRAAERKKDLTAALSKIQSEINALAADKDLSESFVPPAAEKQNASGQLVEAQKSYKFAADSLSRKKAATVEYENKAERLNDYLEEKQRLIDEIAAAEENYRLLTLAADYLTEANDALKTRYRAPIEERLNAYLALLDENPNAPLNIDVDLNVTVAEKSGTKVSDYYSRGLKSEFDICKRFALIDVLFAAEKPFVILDDPFTELDDDKVKSGLALIDKLSENYQILYLVCHDSRTK